MRRRYDQYDRLWREQKTLVFFCVLFCILVLRLFYVQIVQGDYYNDLLAQQNYRTSRLQAERGQIFVTDKAWTQLQLTQNVEYYTMFVDPKFVMNADHKATLIDALTPIIYDHLCVINGLEEPTKEICIENIEQFTWEKLLPERDTFYTFEDDVLTFVDTEEYESSVQEVLEQFDANTGLRLVQDQLEERINQWVKPRNYLASYENEELIAELSSDRRSWSVDVFSDQHVYVKPWSGAALRQWEFVRALSSVIERFWEEIDEDSIRASLQPQDVRYIRLVEDMNAKIAKRIKDWKEDTYEDQYEWIPLMHWVGLETSKKRYYPHGTFMAHLIGYVDENDDSYYGVEQFMDEQLRGKDGSIIGLATPWIWDIWANSFNIQQPEDWIDVFLTIDPVIQKELESTIKFYLEAFRADSIAATVLDPFTWKVIAMANAPVFDPNEYEEAYELTPLPYEERYIVDDLTFIDIPVYLEDEETWELRIATTDERATPWLRKFIFKNYRGPQSFVNNNISFPYEPWSILKSITVWAWIDSDSINLYEQYYDPGKVEVWQFTIANVSRKCKGTHSFSHALGYSCNVWMVRIAQRMSKYVFYQYLNNLGFGELTWIELANEEAGTLPDFNTVSLARYFNNTYGQWILATPLQMGLAYSALVNGGIYNKPTIVERLVDSESWRERAVREKDSLQVFKEETAEAIKEALVNVVESWWLQKYKQPWISLGWKTWTSEIAYKWQYQSWAWRTNWSFVGLVTAEDPRYVVAIQVRRPRTSQYWSDTAWLIFSQFAEFLIGYESIDR